MITLQDRIDELKKKATGDDLDESHTFGIQYAMCIISHTIQKILDDDPKEIFRFCYSLRKADASKYYTNTFLNGLMKPEILLDIIKANTYNLMN